MPSAVSTLIATLVAGLAAGGVHVLSGPDHLAAIAPLAADRPATSWRTGLAWGIGHSTGVWLLAAAALLLRDALPIERLGAISERIVGVVLVAVGLWGLRRLLRTRIHAHEHEHDGVRHVHFHAHDPNCPHDHPHAHGHTHSALAIGTLHGVAGTSHVLGVLPSLLMPTLPAAGAYLLGFGLGSIAAMSGFAWGVGRIVRLPGVHATRLYRRLMATCSLAAIGVGCWWLAA